MNLWEGGWTPHGVVRSGPWGQTLLRNYVERRFKDSAWIDKPAMRDQSP